jgi:hypothetical protein
VAGQLAVKKGVLKMNHSKKPWHIASKPFKSQKDPMFSYCGIVGGGKIVARAVGVGNDEAFANAKLIASAPELLEACKKMLFSFAEVQEKEGYGTAISKFIEAKKAARLAIFEAEKGDI